MFSLSPNIKSLVLNINTTEVLFMQNMFEGCTGLTSLDITSLDTSNVVMMDNMFKQTSNLKSIDLSKMNMNNMESMKGMFDFVGFIPFNNLFC